mmetsp:Transcript_2214/g.4347  ORF Transcript_2214/g.4347 Transcript_2214/m.4347 type:complete len:377 (+) Transcript_2214:132-1262(+)
MLLWLILLGAAPSLPAAGAALAPSPAAAPVERDVGRHSRPAAASLAQRSVKALRSRGRSSAGGAPSLYPDFVGGSWQWSYGNPVDMKMILTGSPSAPAGAPAAAPAGAPAGAPANPDPCGPLQATDPVNFLHCEPVRYFGAGAFGESRPMGCQCGAWSAVCPFQTCSASNAFNKDCLAGPAAAMGFTALSRNFQQLLPDVLPHPMTGFKNHPDVVSLCMYWFPDPVKPGFKLPTAQLVAPMMPPLPPPQPVVAPPPPQDLSSVLPSYANLIFHGLTRLDCLKCVYTPASMDFTKMSLMTTLALPGLKILSVDCGSLVVTIEGPKVDVDQAKLVTSSPAFCFPGANGVQVCTAPLMRAPAGAPGGAPGAAPGPAPGR